MSESEEEQLPAVALETRYVQHDLEDGSIAICDEQEHTAWIKSDVGIDIEGAI